ncbi:MAG: alpha/beta fold hydrolase, partial [Microvirga sp.]
MTRTFDPHAPGFRHQLNGIALHCIEAGPEDGPLVILLHGFPEFWWGWRDQIGPLAEAGFRVLVPDQRGYNLSDKPEGRRAYDLDNLAKDVVGLADAL